MTLTYKQKASISGLDGAFGFFDGTHNYVVGGWTSGSDTVKTFYKSTDYGLTWVAQSDFAYKGHTFASCVANNIAYIVGGDVFSPTNDGFYRKNSYKFENGSWSQISSDCGISDRCLAQLVYHNGSFYLFGGQRTVDPADGVYDTVMKSSDGCASFSVVNSDTKPNFKGGLHWGGWVSFGSKMYRICGGLYRSTVADREHDTAIYSTTDGVTFTYEGEFPGIGRHYHQSVVHGDRLYVICGYNGMYGNNLQDLWSAEISGGRLSWTYEGVAGFSNGRHAHTCWTTPKGIMMFGGSTNSVISAETWIIKDGFERVSTPTLTESGGSVTATCATQGASIYYTTDNTTPTSSSTLYTGAIPVTASSIVKAVGIKTGKDNSLPGIYRGASAGMLDNISNVWLAASTRRLTSYWTGNILRVRRSSDNALTNIGYSGFEVDTTAITNHVGAGNGFVHTMYDQSGNGRDMTNSTNGTQPQIVYSGTLVTGQDSALALSSLDGEGRFLSNAGTLPEAFTISLRMKIDAIPAALKVLVDVGGGGVVQIQYNTTFGALIGLVYVGANQNCNAGAISANTWYHIALTYDGSNYLKFYLDGELVAIKAAGNVTLSQAAIVLGGLTSPANFGWPGDLQDLIIMDIEATELIVRSLMR